MRTRPYIRIVLLALTVASFACSSEEEAPEPAAAPPGDEMGSRTPSAAPSLPDTDSQDETVNGLGNDLPEDMPLYPIERTFSAHRVETKGTDVAVTYQSDDSVDDVMEYYKDAIADDDWELENETTLEQAGGGGVISAWKGNRQLVILTGSNGVETVIGVKILEGKDR